MARTGLATTPNPRLAPVCLHRSTWVVAAGAGDDPTSCDPESHVLPVELPRIVPPAGGSASWPTVSRGESADRGSNSAGPAWKAGITPL